MSFASILYCTRFIGDVLLIWSDSSAELGLFCARLAMANTNNFRPTYSTNISMGLPQDDPKIMGIPVNPVRFVTPVLLSCSTDAC